MGWRRGGVEGHVLSINARMLDEENRYYRWDGMAVHKVSFRTPRRNPLSDIFDVRVFRHTLQEIRRVHPDLVHIHNVSGSSLAPFVACRVAGVLAVATLHDSWLLCPNNMLLRLNGDLCDPAGNPPNCSRCYRRYDFWGDVPWRRKVLAALVANVHTFISPSQALLDLHVRGGYDRTRFRMIRNAIPVPPAAEPSHPGIRRLNSTRREYHTLVYAGGGIETKGAGVLVRALPLLARYVPRLRVAVAGAGEVSYLEQLGRYAPTVQLLGRVPYNEMLALYGAGDLSLAISIWHENMPLVVSEPFSRHTGNRVSAGGHPRGAQRR